MIRPIWLIDKRHYLGSGAYLSTPTYGQANETSVMKGFADDPSTAPYVNDIYAYLQARCDGVLGREPPAKFDQ
jgi:hypothetical protein